MSENLDFGPVTYHTFSQSTDPGLLPIVPGASADQLPVLVDIAEEATELRTLTPEGAAQFSDILKQRFSSMNNIMVASPDQSRDAMQGASLTTDLLSEALRADPEALSAVSGYRGPLHTMAHSARLMHTNQTGHGLAGANYSWTNETLDHALEVLTAVKDKVNDRRWDHASSPSSQANATTAHARKSVALTAARGLQLIAEQRGMAYADPETVAKVTAYLEKAPVRY